MSALLGELEREHRDAAHRACDHAQPEARAQEAAVRRCIECVVYRARALGVGVWSSVL